MEKITILATKISQPALRISLAIVLIWIGGLKFIDPTPVVGLLDASLPFLASSSIVYFLGVLEVVGGAMLISKRAIQYVALFTMTLFGGTILIFLIAPAVVYGEAGFPLLTLAGEFLLKDIVLLSATLVLISRK